MDIFNYIREQLLIEQEGINEGIKSVAKRIKKHLKDPLLKKARARSEKTMDRIDSKVNKLLFRLKKGDLSHLKGAERQAHRDKLERLKRLQHKSFKVGHALQGRQMNMRVGKYLT